MSMDNKKHFEFYYNIICYIQKINLGIIMYITEILSHI